MCAWMTFATVNEREDVAGLRLVGEVGAGGLPDVVIVRGVVGEDKGR